MIVFQRHAAAFTNTKMLRQKSCASVNTGNYLSRAEQTDGDASFFRHTRRWEHTHTHTHTHTHKRHCERTVYHFLLSWDMSARNKNLFFYSINGLRYEPPSSAENNGPKTRWINFFSRRFRGRTLYIRSFWKL